MSAVPYCCKYSRFFRRCSAVIRRCPTRCVIVGICRLSSVSILVRTMAQQYCVVPPHCRSSCICYRRRRCHRRCVYVSVGVVVRGDVAAATEGGGG